MYTPAYAAEYSALYFHTDSIPLEGVFSGAHQVFVCGALQDPSRMSALLGLEPPFAPAAVTGYRRAVECIDGREIPFMIPDRDDPRSVLTGVVWLSLARASLEMIESLELAGGFRKRISIEARIGELDLTAYSYVKR
jgi:hypothetical protein